MGTEDTGLHRLGKIEAACPPPMPPTQGAVHGLRHSLRDFADAGVALSVQVNMRLTFERFMEHPLARRRPPFAYTLQRPRGIRAETLQSARRIKFRSDASAPLVGGNRRAHAGMARCCGKGSIAYADRGRSCRVDRASQLAFLSFDAGFLQLASRGLDGPGIGRCGRRADP